MKRRLKGLSLTPSCTPYYQRGLGQIAAILSLVHLGNGYRYLSYKIIVNTEYVLFTYVLGIWLKYLLDGRC